MRVAVLKEDNCQPKKCNDECQVFCPPVRNGQECIIMDEQTGKPHISESLCIGCGICINKCPHDALIIENLPSELETDMIHRYSMNGFRLFRLPTPSKESVVGILGPNGMGKSTAISALSGRMTPNLGDWLDQEPDWDNVIESLPKGELRDFFIAIQKGSIRVALKPQNVDKLPKRVKGTVHDLLSKVDERGLLEATTRSLGIDHLLQRTVQQLSGGELQRMAICATILRDVDVYFFDEPSSYLDIHERMRIVRIIQELAETKRVIVIEHDLAVLDVLADLVHIVYGKKGAFGIFTPARSTRQAINTYLDGFLPEENVRIRDKPIKFLRHRDRTVEIGTPVVSWGGLEKQLGEFKLTSGEGAVHRSEVVGVVGSNGTGKSTMIKILAGEHEYDEGWVTADATISYKPQHIDVDIDGSVQLWLDSELGPRWRSGEFNVNVIKALGIDQLLPKRVKKLSGGERQAVSIALCLGRDADLYLLDEPSAHLDANARMEAAKAIRRTMEANEKSAFVIDHDVYFIDIVSDSLLVFEGEGGVEGRATGPYNLREGMNRFLAGVDVTFRRDHDSRRPRINKNESRKDREQRNSGDYYSYDA
ncbi:MAG: ribosome biogenesis/translation initiation ATPase RLI [Euryarchaeota archaeon]|nr:ribosome biogenesis/translation initiation ATPase RLI [Euryarchaeota archaeon]